MKFVKYKCLENNQLYGIMQSMYAISVIVYTLSYMGEYLYSKLSQSTLRPSRVSRIGSVYTLIFVVIFGSQPEGPGVHREHVILDTSHLR